MDTGNSIPSPRVELKFCELHAPLFLAGTNLQMKLDPTKRSGLSMVYDRSEGELLVTYNGETAIIPTSNVVSMVEGKTKERVPVESIPHAHRPGVVPTAQVDSPQNHVFAGPGKGKTGKG